ncbi:MAG: universal stress protein [Mariprofundus sp.]|nr:universal stress protein [Mariprofundus sp.]
MIKHGKILVPTDFSEQSSEALRRAVELATLHHAEIHLLHVMEPAIYFETDMIPVSPVNEINNAMRKGANKRLEKQAVEAGFPVIMHMEESTGEPARTICMFAESMPVDLILIGRHGHQGPLEHFLIGSTAERVVRHANCSVLVAMPHGLFSDVSNEE